MSWANVKIEYSLNGSAWTDMSGAANSLKCNPGTRKPAVNPTA